jgi:hypothetical protein
MAAMGLQAGAMWLQAEREGSRLAGVNGQAR